MRAARQRLLFLAAVIGAVLVYVPMGRVTVEREPDLSLRLTAHEAFARPLQFGSEIVYTYADEGSWSLHTASPSSARTMGATLVA